MNRNPADYRVQCDYVDASGNVLQSFDSLDDATALSGVTDPLLAKADLLLDGVVPLREGTLIAYVAAHGARVPLSQYFASMNQMLPDEADSLSLECA